MCFVRPPLYIVRLMNSLANLIPDTRAALSALNCAIATMQDANDAKTSVTLQSARQDIVNFLSWVSDTDEGRAQARSFPWLGDYVARMDKLVFINQQAPRF